MHTISFKPFNAVSSGACKLSRHSFFIPVFIYLLQISYVLTELVTRGQTAHADLVNTIITLFFGFPFCLFWVGFFSLNIVYE